LAPLAGIRARHIACVSGGMKHHRILLLVPFATMVFIACGGQIDSHGDSTSGSKDPQTGSGSTGSGSTGSGSTGSGSNGATTTENNGACANVAGTWLIGQNDCASDDFVIAQDGCNVAVKWYTPFAGSISGNALTFSEADDPSLVCTAAVDGKSFSGSCKGTKADGGPYDCTFTAIFQGS
jgi:hypothetical protein